MSTRRITLIVAVVLALGTGLLTLRYLSSVNAQAQVRQQAVDVKTIVVANRDIPARAKITPDMLTAVTRPANQIEPQALSNPRAAEGETALIALPQGSTLTATKVGRPAGGLTSRLKPGMRAVSIPVDRVKDVSGLIQQGDQVDVLATVNKGLGIPPKTYAIIRGAVVLALNSTLEAAGASPAPDTSGGAATITLGVTAQQADLLTVADLNTTLRLALRPPQEAVGSLPAETLQFADLGQPASTTLPPPILPVRAPANVTAPRAVGLPGSSVTVIDGDHIVSGNR